MVTMTMLITQGGLWIPSDGSVNPTDLCHAFAKGATLKGNDNSKLKCCGPGCASCNVVTSRWPKSYHTTGPKSTFLRHLVCHRTLSKTLL